MLRFWLSYSLVFYIILKVAFFLNHCIHLIFQMLIPNIIPATSEQKSLQSPEKFSYIFSFCLNIILQYLHVLIFFIFYT